METRLEDGELVPKTAGCASLSGLAVARTKWRKSAPAVTLAREGHPKNPGFSPKLVY